MKILNFGSLNIDHVYQVDHIVRPGETLPGRGYQVFAGGKGANQSAALARAGAPVFHAGQVGPEGEWLIDKLASLGVDMQFTSRSETPTGHAIIQVDPQGQNAIVIYPGCNGQITREAVDVALEQFSTGDILLLQNEINELPYLISKGREQGLKICFNPAPFDEAVLDYPLDQVDLFILNETEALGLARADTATGLLDRLNTRLPGAEILLTLGARGARYRSSREELEVPAIPVEAVDTTAAGDTFIGYFLGAMVAGRPVCQALEQATRAAALCVTRPGAMDSIPALGELEDLPCSEGKDRV